MPAGQIHEVAARGFAGAVEAYERGRPGYPADAVAFLGRTLRLGPAATVLDLAAGTGKLTFALARTGARVVAVEPVERMRAALAESLPDVTVMDGVAEAIPLRDAAVEAVTVGQAFHWFDGDAALAEIHRVLKPGGRLGLIWNWRDDSEDWVGRLNELIDRHPRPVPRYADGAWREAFARTRLFTPLERRTFRNPHELDPEGVVARVASISFISALPDSARSELLGQVRELVATHPETAGRETVVLPYRADFYWCERV